MLRINNTKATIYVGIAGIITAIIIAVVSSCFTYFYTANRFQKQQQQAKVETKQHSKVVTESTDRLIEEYSKTSQKEIKFSIEMEKYNSFMSAMDQAYIDAKNNSDNLPASREKLKILFDEIINDIEKSESNKSTLKELDIIALGFQYIVLRDIIEIQELGRDSYDRYMTIRQMFEESLKPAPNPDDTSNKP